MSSPFDAGEQWVQSRAGVRDKAEQFGNRMFRSVMPEQHREVFARPPAVLLAAVDSDGQPHVPILWRMPGFVWSPHSAMLCVEASVQGNAPVAPLLRSQAAIGLLGLESDSGDLLQLQVRAELVWPEHYAVLSIDPPPGAERMHALTPARWTLRRGRLPLSFLEPEASPFLARKEV